MTGAELLRFINNQLMPWVLPAATLACIIGAAFWAKGSRRGPQIVGTALACVVGLYALPAGLAFFQAVGRTFQFPSPGAFDPRLRGVAAAVLAPLWGLL